MKKYRLKQWYPSLPENIKVGDVITFCYGEAKWLYHPNSTLVFKILKNELDNPDFWELLEEPLFVTDDGVEIFSKEAVIYIVNKTFYKKETELCNIYDKSNREDFKYFFHESNADNYIWKNKPVFSYEDFIRWGNVPYERVIIQLAKERSK